MPLFYFSPKLPKISFSPGWCEPKGARSEGSFRDTIVESHQMPGGQSPAGRLSVNLAKVEGQVIMMTSDRSFPHNKMSMWYQNLEMVWGCFVLTGKTNHKRYIDWSTDTTLLEPYNPPLTWAFGTEKGWESFVDPCSLSVYMECGRSFPFPKFVNHPIKKGELDVPLTNKWRCWSCLRSGHLSCLESTFFQVQLTETSFAPLQYI